jgi:DNA-damage-inducible protein D
MSPEKDKKLALFEGRQIRKVLHVGEWWFSIIDVIGALVGGDRPRKYWSDLKKKVLQEGYDQLSEKIGQLKMQSTDGKFYATDCANTETLFRIIQVHSISQSGTAQALAGSRRQGTHRRD